MKINLLFASLLSVFISFTQTFESFNFDGALNANGWTTHSGVPGQFQVLTTPSNSGSSLSYSGLQNSIGNRAIFIAGNTEDLNKAISGISEVGYLSFLINVTNADSLTANGVHFIGFGGAAGTSLTSFAGRVYVKKGLAPNTFQLGILNYTGGTPAPTPNYNLTEFSAGTTLFVVVKLNNTTSPIQASLFLNAVPGSIEPLPTIESSLGTTAFNSFASVYLRHGSGIRNVEIDEIRVGSTWASVTPCDSPTNYYADEDNDGFGNPAAIVQACLPLASYVTNSSDCNDNDAAINPNTIWYADMDGDGFGNANNSLLSCTLPLGYTSNNTDCNDNDSLINPLNTWFVDADLDGFGNPNNFVTSCLQPPGSSINGLDCDDTNAQLNLVVSYYTDADFDGFGTGTGQSLCSNPGAGFAIVAGDCNDSNDQINPDSPEICDGIDNNCAGGIDDGLTFVAYFTDTDDDGFGTGNGQIYCQNPGVGFSLVDGDCNDNNPNAYPGALEVLDNSIDENCDGVDGILNLVDILNFEYDIIPNPSNGAFIIRFNTSVNEGDIIFSDINGKIVLSGKIAGSIFDFNDVNLKKGIYFLSIKASIGSANKRVIIN